MQERKMVNNMEDIQKQIYILNKEISDLLWEKNRSDLNFSQRLKIDHEITSKKEKLYKLLDSAPLFNDSNHEKDRNK